MQGLEILNTGLINKTVIAGLMYPGNKNAKQFLYKKMNCRERHTFNASDNKKVLDIINGLIK